MIEIKDLPDIIDGNYKLEYISYIKKEQYDNVVSFRNKLLKYCIPEIDLLTLENSTRGLSGIKIELSYENVRGFSFIGTVNGFKLEFVDCDYKTVWRKIIFKGQTVDKFKEEFLNKHNTLLELRKKSYEEKTLKKQSLEKDKQTEDEIESSLGLKGTECPVEIIVKKGEIEISARYQFSDKEDAINFSKHIINFFKRK